MTTTITLIILTLFLSAFFSGSEMAFLASNKLAIEINRRNNPKMTRVIDRFLKTPGILISTILVGNNIAVVLYGLLTAALSTPILTTYIQSPTAILLCQTIISTAIVILFAEFLPKTLIQRNPALMLNILAYPLLFFYRLLYPIGYLMQKISNFFIRRLFPDNHTYHEKTILGRVDLDNLLEQQVEVQTRKPSHEIKMMKNTLDFAKTRVRDCAVPRTEIVAVDINDSIDELKQKFITSHLSKIIVYQENIDNIVGFVSVASLFHKPKTIKSITTPIVIVPETMSAQMLLEQFTSHRKTMALVVDEFGGTSGIVTLEDVLEEIFGEINDEHDQQIYQENVLGHGQYQFSARLEIDYLNDKYNLNLPVSEEYNTLAGLILAINNDIPKQGDVIEFAGFEITIVSATPIRIDKVNVKKL